MCSDRRAVLAAALVLAGLAGCGFQPLYSEGSPAAEMIGRVEVSALDGEPGFVMRERLTRRLGPPSDPTHRLDVELDLERVGVALTQQDVTTRFNIVGEARFQLTPLAGGPAVTFDPVISIAGYSAPQSQTASAFAALSAELDAERRVARALADQVVMRLALTAPEWGG